MWIKVVSYMGVDELFSLWTVLCFANQSVFSCEFLVKLFNKVQFNLYIKMCWGAPRLTLFRNSLICMILFHIKCYDNRFKTSII